MKRINNNIVVPFLLAAMCVLPLAGCHRERFSHQVGETVKFRMSVCGESQSRAVYGNVGEKYQEVKWEEGDVFSVCCPSGSGVLVADYKVTGAKSAEENVAVCEPLEGTGLVWGTGEHTFYAAYPAASQNDRGDKLSDAAVLTGHIASKQKPRGAVDGEGTSAKPFTAQADLTYSYFVGKASAFNNPEAPAEEHPEVTLKLLPFTTAIQFDITNGYSVPDSVLHVRTVSLLSKNYKIAGCFTTELDKLADDYSSYKYPKCVCSDGSNVVSFDFTGEDGKQCVPLTPGQVLRFTLFLMPCGGNPDAVLPSTGKKGESFDDLTFRIRKGYYDGDELVDEGGLETFLGYKSGKGVPFPIYKKSFVSGLFVPEGAVWSVKYTPTVENWDNKDISDIIAYPEIGAASDGLFVSSWTVMSDNELELTKYEYGLEIDSQEISHPASTDESTQINVNNAFRTYGSTTYDTDWTVEYQDEDGSWIRAVANETIGGFVKVNPVSGNGSGSFTVTTASGEGKEQTHDQRLRDAEVKGSESLPYDLSSYDIYGNWRGSGYVVTANSYVLNSAGDYAFPMVYGNGVDTYKSAIYNVNAYDPGVYNNNEPNYLSCFKNSRGEGIEIPYIESDLTMEGKEPDISGWHTDILWKSKSYDVDFDVVDRQQAQSLGLALGGRCGYIVFHLGTSNLSQGNILVALKDGDGNVIWSWHLWITDEDLNTKPIEVGVGGGTGNIYSMPLDLGWVDKNDADTPYIDGKTLNLRVVQDGSGNTRTIKVTRRPQIPAPSPEGDALFYQWGRKDPFLKNKFTSTEIAEGTTDLAYSIKNPTMFVYNPCTTVSGAENFHFQWYAEKIGGTHCQYLNLWDAWNKSFGTAATGYAAKPTKTIYDPCPPGFQISQGNAFVDFHFGHWDEVHKAFISDDMYYHLQGYIVPTNGNLTDIGSRGKWWTAVPSNTTISGIPGYPDWPYNASAFCLHLVLGEEITTPMQLRANGCTVRPIEE